MASNLIATPKMEMSEGLKSAGSEARRLKFRYDEALDVLRLIWDQGGPDDPPLTSVEPIPGLVIDFNEQRQIVGIELFRVGEYVQKGRGERVFPPKEKPESPDE